jgi:probable F420-dependent oxidoreductase
MTRAAAASLVKPEASRRTDMKIGISRPYADPGHPLPDVDMGAICQIAEQLGFEWVSYGHHTIRPLDEPVLPPHYGVPLYQDPLIGAARALALTRTLEVVSGVLIMPMQHPVVLAKQVATLDRYGGGRFILGLGTGGASRLEIELTGGRFERRWEYTMESIQVMKGLWTQDRFSFDGDFFKLPPVLCGPRPLSQPHTRLWLGGFSDRVLQRIGAHCDGWLPVFENDRMAFGAAAGRSAVEVLTDSRAKLARFAAAVGRKVDHFEIAIILTPESDPDVIPVLEAAGADRVALTLPEVKDVDAARRALEHLAARVF